MSNQDISPHLNHSSGQNIEEVLRDMAIETEEVSKIGIDEQQIAEQILSELFVDSKKGAGSLFYQQNHIIINPTAIREILARISSYDPKFQCRIYECLREMLIQVQTNSCLLVQKFGREGIETKNDLIDVLISHAFNNITQQELFGNLLSLLSILSKYNNIRKANVQKVLQVVAQNFYSGFINGQLITASLDILSSLFEYQIPFTSEPHSFFYFNGLRSGIKTSIPSDIKWFFGKGMTLALWIYLQPAPNQQSNPFEQSNSNPSSTSSSSSHKSTLTKKNSSSSNKSLFSGSAYANRQAIMSVTCQQREFEFFVDDSAKLYFIGDGKKPTFLVDLMFCHWHFLVLQIVCSQGILSSDKYTVNVLLDQESVASVRIDFPSIKGEPPLEKMEFFRNFLGRVQSVFIFHPNSKENEKLEAFVSLGQHFRCGIDTEQQLAELPRVLGGTFALKALMFLPIRSSSKRIFDICHKTHGEFCSNSGFIVKECNTMCFEHFCGLKNIMPYFYIMRFCDKETRLETFDKTLKLVNLLLKNEKFKCPEEIEQLNFFLVLGQLMNETSLKGLKEETLDVIWEIRDQLSSHLKKQMFSRFYWKVNLIKVNDLAVFNSFYRRIQKIYSDDREMYLKLFSVSDIAEFITERIEPKNLMCCEKHFPLENSKSNTTSPTKENANSDLSAQVGQKSKNFISSYRQKLQIIMNVAEQQLLINSKQIVAKEIQNFIKCLTLNFTPCFYRNVLELLLKLLQSESMNDNLFFSSFIEFQGVQSVLFCLSRCTCSIVKTLCVKLLNEVSIRQSQLSDSMNPNLCAELAGLVSYSLQFTFLAVKSIGNNQPQLPQSVVYEEYALFDSMNITSPEVLIPSMQQQNANNVVVPVESQIRYNLDLSNRQISSMQSSGLEGHNSVQVDTQNHSKQPQQSPQKNFFRKKFSYTPLYVAIMEWMLGKSTLKLSESLVQTGKDELVYLPAIDALSTLFMLSNLELQKTIISDLYCLIFQSPHNQKAVVNSPLMMKFLLSILFNQLAQDFKEAVGAKDPTENGNAIRSNNETSKQDSLWDLTLKILTNCYIHALQTDSQFPLKINQLLGLAKNIAINASNHTTVTRETVGRFLLRGVLLGILDKISSEREFSDTLLQKNLSYLTNLITSLTFAECWSLKSDPHAGFSFYSESSRRFSFVENLNPMPLIFTESLLSKESSWVDYRILLRISELYADCFSSVTAKQKVPLAAYLSPEYSILLDSIFKILFTTQNRLSATQSTHKFVDGTSFGSPNNFQSRIPFQPNLNQDTQFQQNAQINSLSLVEQLFLLESSLCEYLCWKSKEHEQDQKLLNNLRVSFSRLSQCIIVSILAVEGSKQIPLYEKDSASEYIKESLLFMAELRRKWGETYSFVEDTWKDLMKLLEDIANIDNPTSVIKNSPWSKFLSVLFKVSSSDQSGTEQTRRDGMRYLKSLSKMSSLMSSQGSFKSQMSNLFMKEASLGSSQKSNNVLQGAGQEGRRVFSLENMVPSNLAEEPEDQGKERANLVLELVGNQDLQEDQKDEGNNNFRDEYENQQQFKSSIRQTEPQDTGPSLLQIIEMVDNRGLTQDNNNINNYIEEEDDVEEDFQGFKARLIDWECFREDLELIRNLLNFQEQKAFEDKAAEMNAAQEKETIAEKLLVAKNQALQKQRNIRYEDNLEMHTRSAKASWWNIWKLTRYFGGSWRHSKMIGQQNQLFKDIDYSYEAMTKPECFHYKVSKYSTKQLLRPMLKAKLIDPAFAIAYESKKIDKENLKREQNEQLRKINSYLVTDEQILRENLKRNKREQDRVLKQMEKRNKEMHQIGQDNKNKLVIDETKDDLGITGSTMDDSRSQKLTKKLIVRCNSSIIESENQEIEEVVESQDTVTIKETRAKSEYENEDKIREKAFSNENKNGIKSDTNEEHRGGKWQTVESSNLGLTKEEAELKEKQRQRNCRILFHEIKSSVDKGEGKQESQLDSQQIAQNKDNLSKISQGKEQIGAKPSVVSKDKRLKLKKRAQNFFKSIKDILYLPSKISNYGNSNEAQEQSEVSLMKAQWIKTLTARNGWLKIDQEHITFFVESMEQGESHLSMVCHVLPANRSLIKQWDIDQIKSFSRGRYVQRKTAVELYFLDGTSALFNFPNNDLEIVVGKLESIRKSSSQIVFKEKLRVLDKNKLTKKWQNRSISTLKYLMKLNQLGGRSFRDLTQYPVLPWIWMKYTQDSIDLADLSLYRDLAKPVGAIGTEERCELFRDKYESTSEAGDFPPYNYGTHYSSPAIVLSFLLRIQPFSSGAWELQSKRFDVADRLFSSMQETFRSITEDLSDVRELVPEMFCLPELFLNLEKFDFGLTQQKNRVHHVRLPEWCAGNDPYEFICKHRKSMESEAVSKSVNHWIDLIFGYKQKGKLAVDALNVFYYITYEDGLDLNSVMTESAREGFEAQIVHFGQCPTQLLQNSAHPARIFQQSAQCLFIDEGTNPAFFPYPGGHNNFQPNQQPIVNSQNIFLSKLNFEDIDDKAYQKQLKNIEKKVQSLKPRAATYIQFVDNSKFYVLRRNAEVSQVKLINSGDGKEYPFKSNVTYDKQLEVDMVKKDRLYGGDFSCAFSYPPAVFLNQGKYLLCGGLWGGLLKLWDIETEKVLCEFPGIHQTTVTALAFYPQYTTLCTGTKDGQVNLIKLSQDSKSFVEVHEYFDHTEEVTCIVISDDMRCVLSGSIDGTINMYNIFNYKKVRHYTHPYSLPIHHIAVSTSPLYAIVMFSKDDATFYSYSINGQQLGSFKELSKQILQPLILQDSQQSDTLAFVSYQTQEMRVLEMPFLKLRVEVKKPLDMPNIIAWAPSLDRKFAVCSAEDSTFFFFLDHRAIVATVNKTVSQFI